MLYEHEGYRPDIHPTASIAPSAIVSGNVVIGPETRVLHGAVVSAQGGEVRIGSRCVVMENALLRGTKRHTLKVGSNVLIGPHVYLTGCDIGDDVFLATGSTVFNGARIAHGSEVRVNGVVHLLTELPPESLVPIGWVAVGRPASVLPPDEHDRIWELQEPLDFPGEVFGVERSTPGASKMPELCRRYTRFLAGHDKDTRISNIE